MPDVARRARRSRAVKIELFVRMRNGRPLSRSARTNSGAPGIAWPSWTSTPSMSVSQLVISRVMSGVLPVRVGLADGGRVLRDPVLVGVGGDPRLQRRRPLLRPPTAPDLDDHG